VAEDRTAAKAPDFNRPDVEAPLIVWEYAFALERRVKLLEAKVAMYERIEVQRAAI
jgi:hypothetical protein